MNQRERVELLHKFLLEKTYRQAIELGLDPDNFDSQAFVTWHDEGMGGQSDIGGTLKMLQIVKRKLEEIA